MACLLDTNVLLRYVHRADPAHADVLAAVHHLRDGGEMLCMAPQNGVECWNVATRPVNRNGFGLTPVQAARMLDLLEQLFPVLPETPVLYPTWRALVAAAEVSGVQVHDARLVAWMQVHRITHLFTLNPRDFARYEPLAGITVLDLSGALRSGA